MREVVQRPRLSWIAWTPTQWANHGIRLRQAFLAPDPRLGTCGPQEAHQALYLGGIATGIRLHSRRPPPAARCPMPAVPRFLFVNNGAVTSHAFEVGSSPT